MFKTCTAFKFCIITGIEQQTEVSSSAIEGYKVVLCRNSLCRVCCLNSQLCYLYIHFQEQVSMVKWLLSLTVIQGTWVGTSGTEPVTVAKHTLYLGENWGLSQHLQK